MRVSAGNIALRTSLARSRPRENWLVLRHQPNRVVPGDHGLGASTGDFVTNSRPALLLELDVDLRGVEHRAIVVARGPLQQRRSAGLHLRVEYGLSVRGHFNRLR